MRLIGILGGTSWPSTISAYRMLNEAVQRRLTRDHSARIVLYSVDYGEMLGDWGQADRLLLKELRKLLSFAPDCWMIANNTLHKFYDEIRGELPDAPPMFHAIDLVRGQLMADGVRRVLLLGTRFTMEQGYYAGPLRAAGIEVVIPKEADRAHIEAVQRRLAHGEVDPGFAPYFGDLIGGYADAGCEAVVAACTELPLVITPELSAIALIDPLRLQCEACVDFALAP
jgi:aspartate racemase